MKRTIEFFPWHAPAASVLLTLSLSYLAGCSNSGEDGTDAGVNILDKSELSVVKKTAKNRRDFMKLYNTKIREKEGAVAPTNAAGKVAEGVR